ncbi:hypothetical protein ACHAXA_002445, partial [Cyclostephanos tholiformis]
EILALLNDGDDDRAVEISNDRRQLSRRGAGGGGGGGGCPSPLDPPPHRPPEASARRPSRAAEHIDKERRRKRRIMRPWSYHNHQFPAPHYIALVTFALSCAAYSRYKGYRIKLRIRGLPPSWWSSPSSLLHLRRDQTSSSSTLIDLTAGGASPPSTSSSATAGGWGPSSFIDPAWIGKDGAQYQTLIPPSHVDFSIPRRSRWVRGKDRHCDDIILFLSPSLSDGYDDDGGGGEGVDPTTTRTSSGSHELRGYFLAAVLATYTNRAMVVLDAPPSAGNGNDGNDVASSWYDCAMGDVVSTNADGAADAADAVAAAAAAAAAARSKRERRNRNRRRKRGDAPAPVTDPLGERVGLNRLLQHPQWLSHGCPVPCSSSYDYSMWDDVRRRGQGDVVVERVTCRNDNDRQAIVSVYGPNDIYEHFQRMWTEEMSKLKSSDAYRWALRLGAHGQARAFASLRDEGDIWNYVTSLMARSGIVRFTPWIAIDIKARIKLTDLPLNSPYTAISAYRGGDDDGIVSAGSTTRRPRDLLAYFQQLESNGCNEDMVRPVYIATDDPGWIQDEIDRFLGVVKCRGAKFILSSSVDELLDDADVGRTHCSRLHRAKISTISDLMILAKSETYFGGSDGFDPDWLVPNESAEQLGKNSCVIVKELEPAMRRRSLVDRQRSMARNTVRPRLLHTPRNLRHTQLDMLHMQVVLHWQRQPCRREAM